jgi:hypothetical protein
MTYYKPIKEIPCLKHLYESKHCLTENCLILLQGLWNAGNLWSS